MGFGTPQDEARSRVYEAAGGGYNGVAWSPLMKCFKRYSTAIGLFMLVSFCDVPSVLAGDLPASGEELQIEVTKKGLGKQVVISRGTKEWFMLIDVTPDNSVVVRQEKDGERYVVDETETHDRPMAQDEVEAAITDYVDSVKARAK